MQDGEYFKSVLPDRATVLGLPLLPFSIGHFIHLSRIESPFLPQFDNGAGAPELITAVLICSQTFEESRDFRASLWERLKLAIWSQRIRKADWNSEADAFGSYISEGMKYPKIKPSSSDGRPPGAPLVLRAKRFLNEQGMSESQALNFPYRQAFWEWFAWLEKEGKACIQNESEMSFVENKPKSLEELLELQETIRKATNA